ncbi:hypothetical protein BGZ98_006707 [Dissophora globulifera]|nr:hypothetical protein BGZ98_006707 [Dissophora globulifera]
MLKREAFQELASQTQRFDDIFVAKMIYWESLGAEEKAQWLERGHEDRPTAGGISTLQSGADNVEQDDIDDLVDALECRATCKDYSALLAFEKQAELETRQRHC